MMARWLHFKSDQHWRPRTLTEERVVFCGFKLGPHEQCEANKVSANPNTGTLDGHEGMLWRVDCDEGSS